MAALVDFVLAYLFYNTWIAAAVMLPVSVFFWHEQRESCCRKKELQFREQFRNSIQMMSSMLKVGYSVENALRETEKELRTLYPKESRIRKEFERMGHELDMNRTAEQALKDFAKRVKQEDVDNFVTVFAAAKRVGGDSISILRETVRIIGDKMETEREIQTMLAAKRLEFRVMCVIPLGMVFYMRLAFPEFLSVLYGNPAGGILMSVCLGMYAFAYWLGNRMIRIEV